MFKLELMDKEKTKIEAVFFDEAAEKFDAKIEENKIYNFSHGTIRIADKWYTPIKFDFCIVFEKYSEIVEVEDNNSIAQDS